MSSPCCPVSPGHSESRSERVSDPPESLSVNGSYTQDQNLPPPAPSPLVCLPPHVLSFTRSTPCRELIPEIGKPEGGLLTAEGQDSKSMLSIRDEVLVVKKDPGGQGKEAGEPCHSAQNQQLPVPRPSARLLSASRARVDRHHPKDTERSSGSQVPFSPRIPEIKR